MLGLKLNHASKRGHRDVAVALALAITVNASESKKSVCRQRSAQRSLVTRQCSTHTEVYINKTGVQDKHHTTLLCMRYVCIYAYIDRYYLITLHWVHLLGANTTG